MSEIIAEPTTEEIKALIDQLSLKESSTDIDVKRLNDELTRWVSAKEDLLSLKKPSTNIDVKRPNEDITRLGHKVAKIRRGLPGFINGARTAALADTGAAQNVVSLDFAHKHGLVLEGKAAMFRLGNSKSVQSVGQSKQVVEVVAVTIYTC